MRGAWSVPDWLSITGSVASVVGLAGSLKGWHGAWRERQRAQALIRCAEDKQLVEDLSRLCGTAQLIASAVSPEAPGAARYLADQLCAETVSLRGRHLRRAPVGLRQSLFGAEHEALQLARWLTSQNQANADWAATTRALVLRCMTALADAKGYAQDVVSSSLAEGNQDE